MKIGRSLVELAETSPRVELDSRIAQLRTAGVQEIYLALATPGGALVESAAAEAARSRTAAIIARSRRVSASQEIDWSAGASAFEEALDGLVTTFRRFDQLSRLRLAASDMRLAANAANGLVDARENDGPARLYERVIETGMVVTYARPFLKSNEAGIGEKWWPKDEEERAIHDELLDLRHEYHAHAAHTPRRRLENTAAVLGRQGRPSFAESWEELPAQKLRKVAALAERLAGVFADEAERLDIELFGPHSHT